MDREQKLDEVITAYLKAVEAGTPVDEAEWLRRYPELADELAEFFAGQRSIERMAAPFRERIEPTPTTADSATLPPATRSGSFGPTGTASDTDPGEAAPIKLGDKVRYFGDYELLEEIARGGMGVVYKARQVSLNRLVALKMILAGELASDADVKRFYAEAQTAANLQHPNIVAIHEVGEHNGQRYFSMDLVEGQSLSALTREHPLPPNQAAAIVQTVAEAIHYAHQKGVLHRDLKPSNILMARNDKRPRLSAREEATSEAACRYDDEPRVTDFGLAKRIEGGANLTATGAVLGTPSYMPPEQASADRGPVGPASDVYALGAVLYELVTGRPPFQGPTPVDIILQVLSSDPVSPRQLQPKLPRNLETICLKCLHKEPAKRYASAADLAEDLRRFLAGEPILARPVRRVERAVKWVRRNPAIAGLTAAVAFALLAGTGVSVYFAIDATAKKTLAETSAEVAKKERERAEDSAEKAKASAEQARLEKDRADRGAEQAQDILARSLFEQAQALRRTTQPGRRDQALALLQEAETLRSRTRKVEVEPAKARGAGLSAQLPTQLELRNEAIATIFLQDARLIRELQLGITGSAPAISLDGRIVAAAWREMDVAKIGKGDFSGSKTGIEVMELADGGKSARWNRPITAMLGSSLAISPDNQFIASSSQKLVGADASKFQFELRDVWEGKLVKVLDWPQDDKTEPDKLSSRVHCLFSPDGRYLAATHADLVATQLGGRQMGFALWDLKTGQGRILARDASPAGAWLLFTTDGKRLAYPASAKSIAFWDLDKAAVAKTIELPLPILGQSVLSPGDDLLAAPCKGSADLQIMILVWDMRKQAEKARFTVRGVAMAGTMTGLAFRPGTTQLAMGDGQGFLVADVADGKEIMKIEAGHKLGLAHLAWQADGQRLFSTSLDGQLKIWSVSATPPVITLHPQVDAMAGLALSPTGNALGVAATQSLEAWLIDPMTGATLRTFASSIPSSGKAGFSRVSFRPDGKQLAAFTTMGKASVWDVETGKEVARLDTKDTLQSGAFSAEGHFLATLNQKDKVVLWDVHDSSALWESTGEQRRGSLGYAVGQGRRVVVLNTAMTFFDKSDFVVYDLPQGNKTGPFPLDGGMLKPTFSPDGDLMAIAYLASYVEKSPERGVVVWNLATGKKLLNLKVSPASHGFSADSRLVWSVGFDGSLILWDVAADREVLRGLFEARDVAFSSDGKTLALRGINLATGGASASIRMLDLAALRARLAKMGLDW